MSNLAHSRSIALIGFPSSGKSTMGPLLAQSLGYAWLDSDQQIALNTGRSPAEWLQTMGEPAFRKAERHWLQAWNPVTPCVLSTGGGLPCYQNNLDLLKHKALTVYLELDFESLRQRLYTPPGHALTRLYDPEGLKVLYARRAQIYTLADLSIAATGNPDEILTRLLQKLKARD